MQSNVVKKQVPRNVLKTLEYWKYGKLHTTARTNAPLNFLSNDERSAFLSGRTASADDDNGNDESNGHSS